MSRPYRTQLHGRSVTVDPAQHLVLSDDSPPDLNDFVFKPYRGTLGDRKGKFFVGKCGPLFLTLQANFLGEECRLQLDSGTQIAAKVSGSVGRTAIAGPEKVFGVTQACLVCWTWKPDGFASKNKVFAADMRWLDPQNPYQPDDYETADEEPATEFYRYAPQTPTEQNTQSTQPTPNHGYPDDPLAGPEDYEDGVDDDFVMYDDGSDYVSEYVDENGEAYAFDDSDDDIPVVEDNDFDESEPYLGNSLTDYSKTDTFSPDPDKPDGEGESYY